MTNHQKLTAWVDEMVRLCKPDRVVWCDGSEDEKRRLTADALRSGDLEELNQEKLPGCYLHHSALNDVARTEHLTYICTPTKDETGPTNNWMEPGEAYRTLGGLFDGSMKGRTMYVVPFVMGPARSPFSKVVVELTDSLYVALNIRIISRMGKVALDMLGETGEFTKALHSKGDLDMARRFICHFPQDNTIWSIGSGYGGNALLGKKCMALRIASCLGRQEGWLAEHMLIVGIENPKGETSYVAAAFPSACGKTNLAMLVPPASLPGYKIWTVGDDIAWLRIGPDGRLWAINPEAGFFGVAPGTNKKSNPNALATVQKNSIYTNVALLPDKTVWWEGMDGAPPEKCLDWKNEPWTPASKEKAAHPNSRFTAPASQCPSISPEWENPAGVPITAIIFGGRRSQTIPLVFESFNWQHGVFVGATMSSETTAAAIGAVGVVRRDPMAMLPFCGYNMGDYLSHWIGMGDKIKHPPKIFNVNWFRTGPDGKFLWPGFGDNLRVLLWILDRCEGRGPAVKTPIGLIPTPDALNLTGLNIDPEALRTLLHVDRAAWQAELDDQKTFFNKLGDRMSPVLTNEHAALSQRLRNA
ncbi:MAG TPA: phosphoenolpyruvate carboxykinase (GTP) [Elusimicrobiota bacterium]|nr:phosphoenolpyruvate carboxykinase (GTP) [Elusimicrobiota bacterium]